MPLSVLGIAVAIAGGLILTACNDNGQRPQANAPASAPVIAPVQPAASTAQVLTEATPVAYQLPAASVLYQMVAPIALYPDKLVAQVLASATYPDQVSAAEVWIAQNPQLIKNDTRNNAASEKPWDPSIKALTEFPNVLEQLASNLPWTTALGKAYYNHPTDVLNAIQVMRERANKAGTLKSSNQLKVTAAPQPTPVANYTPSADMEVNDYPEPVIPQPGEYIEISENQPDMVFVPRYDPALVYGEPMPVYTGYRYAVPAPVVAGLIGFGSGVVLVQTVEHRPWGWHRWNMHWGQRDTSARGWHPGEPPPPPAARPAVIFNNTTYVSRSPSVVDPNRRAQDRPRFTPPPPEAQLPSAAPENMHDNRNAALAAGAAAMAMNRDRPPMPPSAAIPPTPMRHDMQGDAHIAHMHERNLQQQRAQEQQQHQQQEAQRRAEEHARQMQWQQQHAQQQRQQEEQARHQQEMQARRQAEDQMRQQQMQAQQQQQELMHQRMQEQAHQQQQAEQQRMGQIQQQQQQQQIQQQQEQQRQQQHQQQLQAEQQRMAQIQQQRQQQQIRQQEQMRQQQQQQQQQAQRMEAMQRQAQSQAQTHGNRNNDRERERERERGR